MHVISAGNSRVFIVLIREAVDSETGVLPPGARPREAPVVLHAAGGTVAGLVPPARAPAPVVIALRIPLRREEEYGD